MFENFKPVKADPILGLSKLCNEDPREGALDLGVGFSRIRRVNTDNEGGEER